MLRLSRGEATPPLRATPPKEGNSENDCSPFRGAVRRTEGYLIKKIIPLRLSGTPPNLGGEFDDDIVETGHALSLREKSHTL
jgi:hypothetical protein